MKIPEFNLYTVNPFIDGIVGWWLPNAWGYTKLRSEAGRYSLEEAIRHTENCGEDDLQVVMVPVCEDPGGYFEVIAEQIDGH